MDLKQLRRSKGFTLLELLAVLILIGIISTITLTNSSFLKTYDSDQINSYKSFIEYLTEESALTKKHIAWFVGNNTQYIAAFKNNEWQTQTLGPNMLPAIQLNTQFQDNHGNIFYINETRDDPFLIFYPSGKASGGAIEYSHTGIEFVLTINSFSVIEIIRQEFK